jgi:HK97 family phage major capsid protein
MVQAPITATRLANVNSTLLPPEITGPIFTKATESSAVMSLARRVPLSVTAQTAIPVPLDVPQAGWVSEGGAKPVGASGVGLKQMFGKKVACLVPVSEEVANANPAALWEQLQNDLPTAIARAFDRAAIHGTNPDGTAGPFADYLLKNAQVLSVGGSGGSTALQGGVYADLVKAEKVVDDAGWDFSGWAADPRLRSLLKLSVDTIGRPLYVPNSSSNYYATDTSGALGGQLDGFPVFYNRGVSGKLIRATASVDTNLRAVGGDFSQCAYGVGMEINIKRSFEASYIDSAGNTHHAFQENLVLILAEAYYGFVANDTTYDPNTGLPTTTGSNAFVALTSGTLTS